jgi:hypothetical protein
MSLKSDIKTLILASFAEPDPAVRDATIDAYATQLAAAIAAYIAVCKDAEARPLVPGPTV